LNHTLWHILPKVPESLKAPDIHPLLLQLLYNRGMTTLEQMDVFLANDRRAEADPFLIPDMSPAVLRTHRALLSAEKIAIYGDFDADGITATALLVQGLSALGADVIPYIPNRSTEGYGLSVSALERLRSEGVSLVITCDTGVTAFTEAERAKKMGVDIIVTDHHVPMENLPQALAVVDPKRVDSKYPMSDIAGVGVAYKFLQALITDKAREPVLQSVVDLVAIGTITDMVTLVGENRYWVKSGLNLINNTRRLGLQELIRSTNLTPGKIESQNISWVIGPRINSAGRMDNATTSYELLLTNDRNEAAKLVHDLEKKNSDRAQQTNELVLKATEAINAYGADKPILFAGEEDYASGVMGLVAGRLTDKFYRPVILFKMGKDMCRGSGRSIPEFDLIGALVECQDLLTRFGGHTRAAGLNVATKDLPELQKKLTYLAQKKLAGLDLHPHIDIDAEVDLPMFLDGTFQQMQSMAPFGTGNPVPTFVSRDVDVIERSQIGNDGAHLRLKLRQNSTVWDAVGWGMGSVARTIKPHLDIAYSVEINRWNGQENLRLNLIDFAAAKQ
jgi:single-stranded-DNA-specific exonuclease